MLRRKGLAGVFGVLLAIFFASAAAAHTGSGLAGVTWDTVHSFVGPALIAASEEGDQNEQGDQNDQRDSTQSGDQGSRGSDQGDQGENEQGDGGSGGFSGGDQGDLGNGGFSGGDQGGDSQDWPIHTSGRVRVAGHPRPSRARRAGAMSLNTLRVGDEHVRPDPRRR
jgi:hypothetical protein